MEKEKPIIGQKVFVLLSHDMQLYQGEVHHIYDTPLRPSNTDFVFETDIKNQVFFPASEFLSAGIRKNLRITTGQYHFNPSPFHNISFTNGCCFSPAFVFTKKELYEKWKDDVRALKREYHLQQAELYK